MPLATIAQSTYNTTPLTVVGVLNAIKAAMAVVNVTTAAAPYLVTTDLFSDRATASGFLVYRIITDSTKTKGTAYLRIVVSLSGTTLSVSQSLSDTWDTTTNTTASGALSAGTSSTTVNFNTGIPLTITTIKHPEAQLVLLDQGLTPIAVLGWMRPNFKNPAWDEASCPFVFFPTDATFTTFLGVNAGIIPYTSLTNFPLGGWTNFQKVNPRSLQPDIKPGVDLLTNTNEGAAGTFSTDIAIASVAGITRMNTLTTGYTILTSNTSTYGVLILGTIS